MSVLKYKRAVALRARGYVRITEQTAATLQRCGVSVFPPTTSDDDEAPYGPAWAAAAQITSGDADGVVVWLANHPDERDAVQAVAVRDMRRAIDLVFDLYRHRSEL